MAGHRVQHRTLGSWVKLRSRSVLKSYQAICTLWYFSFGNHHVRYIKSLPHRLLVHASYECGQTYNSVGLESYWIHPPRLDTFLIGNGSSDPLVYRTSSHVLPIDMLSSIPSVPSNHHSTLPSTEPMSHFHCSL